MPAPMRPRVSSATVGSSLVVRVVVASRRLVAEVAADELDQRLADQARLARAGDAGDRGQHAERKARVEVVQVVARDAAQLEPACGSRGARRRGSARGEQVARGVRRRARARRPVGRPAVEDAAAVLAGVGADVDDPVGAPHRRQVVLDDEERIAAIA